MALEEQLFEDVKNGRQVDIERALLIASGCDTEEKVSEYKAKIGELERQFDAYASARNVQGEEDTARALHEFLWDEKPKSLLCRAIEMFGIGGRYALNKGLLTETIDRQMSPNSSVVGNCFGLTELYTVLGLRKGLNVSVLHTPQHVLSRIRTNGNKVIDIENTSRRGFGKDTRSPESGMYDGLKECGLAGLLGFLYVHKGNKHFREGDVRKAGSNFWKAATLVPEDSQALSNYGACLHAIGKHKDAAAALSKAIEISPCYERPYLARSRARKALGDIIGSEQDMEMYFRLGGDCRVKI